MMCIGNRQQMPTLAVISLWLYSSDRVLFRLSRTIRLMYFLGSILLAFRLLPLFYSQRSIHTRVILLSFPFMVVAQSSL
jgi:hypothetical protein